MSYTTALEAVQRQVEGTTDEQLLSRYPSFTHITPKLMEALRLHEQIVQLNEIAKSAGAATLLRMWEMWRTGAWMEFNPRRADGQEAGDFTFTDYVNQWLGGRRAGDNHYFSDLQRIIENIFQYVYARKINIEKVGLVTPELLLERGGMYRLQRATQRIRALKLLPGGKDALVGSHDDHLTAFVLGIAEREPREWFDEYSPFITRDEEGDQPDAPIVVYRLPLPEYRVQYAGGLATVTFEGLTDMQLATLMGAISHLTRPVYERKEAAGD